MKTVFFCGQQSRYGMSHLSPILDNFNVLGVVFATNERWKIFREKLHGKSYYFPRSSGVFSMLTRLIPPRIKEVLKGGMRDVDRSRRALRDRNIPVWDIFDINSKGFVDQLQELNADLYLSAAYPQIVSKKVLEIPLRGAINFHPSLLPKYRGAHPHFWQIVRGETEGGVTAHFMTERIDDGDIVAQFSFPISDYTYSQLYDRIIEDTPRLVHKVRSFFEQEDLIATPQNPEDATYFRNNREIHSRIFWKTLPAQDILNLIRTETAFFFIAGKRVTVLAARLADSNRNLTNNISVENGTVVDIDQDGIVVRVLDGCVTLNYLQIGRRDFSHFEFARKINLHIGEIFG